jgi:hypothetical protein
MTPLHPSLLLAMLIVGAFCYGWGANLDRIERWLNK